MGVVDFMSLLRARMSKSEEIVRRSAEEDERQARANCRPLGTVTVLPTSKAEPDRELPPSA